MYEEHMKMHTMIKNISWKDAHLSEPLHERSKGCAVRIKIGLYFQSIQAYTQRYYDTVTACWEDIKYNVTVTDGTASVTLVSITMILNLVALAKANNTAKENVKWKLRKYVIF